MSDVLKRRSDLDRASTVIGRDLVDLDRARQQLLDQCVWEDRGYKGGPCWIWTGNVWGGYGRMFFGGRHSEATHRVSHMVRIGPIPEGMWVLHDCDQKLCCDHTHLFLGTPQDNVDDMFCKGRNAITPVGGWRPKFTEADVLGMREMAAQGHSHAFIAECFGSDPSWIGPVVRGEARKDIGGPITVVDRPKTSRFVGVHFNQRDSRWQSRIKIDGATYFLGNFADEIDAARAYNAAVVANNLNRPLNQIDNPDQRKETPCVDQEQEAAEVTAVETSAM